MKKKKPIFLVSYLTEHTINWTTTRNIYENSIILLSYNSKINNINLVMIRIQKVLFLLSFGLLPIYAFFFFLTTITKGYVSMNFKSHIQIDNFLDTSNLTPGISKPKKETKYLINKFTTKTAAFVFWYRSTCSLINAPREKKRGKTLNVLT